MKTFTAELIKKTKIAPVVSNVKKNYTDNQEIFALSKELLITWKNLFPPQKTPAEATQQPATAVSNQPKKLKSSPTKPSIPPPPPIPPQCTTSPNPNATITFGEELSELTRAYPDGRKKVHYPAYLIFTLLSL